MLRNLMCSLYNKDGSTDHWIKMSRFVGALEALTVAPKQEYCRMVNECYKV